MSKIKDYFNDEFDAAAVLNRALVDFANHSEKDVEATNQIPLKFLFCFTAGIVKEIA